MARLDTDETSYNTSTNPRNIRKTRSEEVKNEYWANFGKIINPRLINDGQEDGFVSFVSMPIDNIDYRKRNRSADKPEWDAKALINNQFVMALEEARDSLKVGGYLYINFGNNLAVQVYRVDPSKKEKHYNVEELRKDNPFINMFMVA